MGTGGRLWLPSFALLLGVPAVAHGQSSDPLSLYQRTKAEWLLENRLACLACHALDGVGGRIGPDLSQVGGRRTPAFIRAMLVDPRGANPNGTMPREPISPSTLDLLVTYLAERGGPLRGNETESGRDDSHSRGARSPAAEVYARLCAACHGAQGRGDGPNARYLPVRPTVHADGAYMALRPDDVLYDAIYAGGYVMDRSNRMPGFGHTLAPETIRGLVRYLRELCRCEGPAWSRDGSR